MHQKLKKNINKCKYIIYIYINYTGFVFYLKKIWQIIENYCESFKNI